MHRISEKNSTIVFDTIDVSCSVYIRTYASSTRSSQVTLLTSSVLAQLCSTTMFDGELVHPDWPISENEHVSSKKWPQNQILKPHNQLFLFLSPFFATLIKYGQSFTVKRVVILYKFHRKVHPDFFLLFEEKNSTHTFFLFRNVPAPRNSQKNCRSKHFLLCSKT